MTEEITSKKILPPFLFPDAQADAFINSHRILGKCKNRTVVLSGCGGGCDVYGAAYLFNQVRAAGAKKIILTNLTFSSRWQLSQGAIENPAQRKTKCVLEPGWCYKVFPGIDVESEFNDQNPRGIYFPEAALANALNHPVFAFPCVSVAQIAEAHIAMLKEEATKNTNNDDDEEKDENQKAVLFLIDGGCDVLLSGRETGLATPVEDMLHLRAIQKNLIGRYYDPEASFICALGANVDSAHGVVESELVTRLCELKSSGGLLISKTLTTQNDQNAKFFCEVVKKCFPVWTIVQSLAVAAIEGNRGLFTPENLKQRIGRNKIPLSELTSTFFFFDLNVVAKEVEYLGMLDTSDTPDSLVVLLSKYRKSIGKN